MSEFRSSGELTDARAALNATTDQLHAAVDGRLTEGGGCCICGRERHENFEQLKPCVAEVRRRSEAA